MSDIVDGIGADEPPWDRIQEIINETGDLEGSSFAGAFDDYLKPYRERFIVDEARFRNKITEARAKYAASEVPPTERQILAISRIEYGLAALDKFLKKWPVFIIKRVLIKLAEAETETTPEMLNQVRVAFAKSDVVNRSEIKHFLNLLTTDDPLGIILRGHVLIENELDKCIVSSFIHPQRLHDDLKLFYAEKVRLAFALGLINEKERVMLNSLGKVRNGLVHHW